MSAKKPKKYTIVYRCYGRGDNIPFQVKIDNVLTNAMQDLLKTAKYYCLTIAVFDGWPKQEKIP